MPPKIHYRKLTKAERGGKSYKYELTKAYIQRDIDLGYKNIFIGGYVYYSAVNKILYIRKGYRWDGSTRVFDTEYCMRASLVHDVFYQLFREGKLGLKYRKFADKLYRDMMIEDGAWKWWAGVRYTGLRTKAAWDFIWRKK